MKKLSTSGVLAFVSLIAAMVMSYLFATVGGTAGQVCGVLSLVAAALFVGFIAHCMSVVEHRQTAKHRV